MDAAFVAIITVGVSLAALILTGLRSIRTDLRSGLEAAAAERQAIRTDLRSGLEAAVAELQAIREDLRSLGERVARLEGAFSFFAPRSDTNSPAA